MSEPRAFITGSYAYGDPRPDSDIDLVALVSTGELFWLSKLADVADRATTHSASDEPQSASLRFGKLNLILTDSEALFGAWREGTEELKARKPVTRNEAIAVLRPLREKAYEAEAAASVEARP